MDASKEELTSPMVSLYGIYLYVLLSNKHASMSCIGQRHGCSVLLAGSIWETAVTSMSAHRCHGSMLRYLLSLTKACVWANAICHCQCPHNKLNLCIELRHNGTKLNESLIVVFYLSVQKHCVNQQAALASVRSPSEYNFLQSLAQVAGRTSAWLGGFYFQVSKVVLWSHSVYIV